MRYCVVIVTCLAACGAEPPPGGGRPSPPTEVTDTGPWTTGVAVDVACMQSEDNALRWSCAVTLAEPGPVTLVVQDQGAERPARAYTSGDAATEHTLTVWLLAPNTTYEWTATAGADTASGSFDTKDLPDKVTLRPTLDGEASFPYFLAISPCLGDGYVFVADTRGTVLWYQEFGTSLLTLVDAVTFTPDRTILAVVGGSVIEVDLLGRELLRLEVGTDFEEGAHHDVFRDRDGYTWVLHHDTALWYDTALRMDGFYVFDPAGVLVADWRLFDHFQPPSGVLDFDALDYSHANAIWVTDAHEVYLSFRHLSAVALVQGDLGSPDFGEITWRLSGDPEDTDFGTDFVLGALDPDVSPTFVQQHNPHPLPDGTLALFDNRIDLEENSRLLHLALDPAGGEATILEAYQLPVHCAYQGGALHTAGGNPVATCAPDATAYEFDAGVTDAHRWSLDMACDVGLGTYVPRFVPLEESDLAPTE